MLNLGMYIQKQKTGTLELQPFQYLLDELWVTLPKST